MVQQICNFQRVYGFWREPYQNEGEIVLARPLQDENVFHQGICNWQGITTLDKDNIPGATGQPIIIIIIIMIIIMMMIMIIIINSQTLLAWPKACAKEKEPTLKGEMTHAIRIVSIILKRTFQSD